jgi:uncharacterized membrane protein YdbT with pleckstrin-like domain
MALGVFLLWSASLLWAHHSGATSERQAQAQKAEKVTKQHKKKREQVEDKVNDLPEAPTVPVRDAPADSASAELLRDWSRPR